MEAAAAPWPGRQLTIPCLHQFFYRVRGEIEASNYAP